MKTSAHLNEEEEIPHEEIFFTTLAYMVSPLRPAKRYEVEHFIQLPFAMRFAPSV